MLRITGTPSTLCDRVSRRELLRVGALGTLGVSLADLLRQPQLAQATNTAAPRARSCIVLFLMGGPPQHSTWDPKPQAPAEVRGEFAPIATTVPGMSIGELLPQTAKVAERLCLLRAVRTGDNAHSSSGYYMMTGVPHQPKNFENANPGAPNNWPHLAAIVRRLSPADSAFPATVRLPHHIFNTDGSVWPGQDAGFLGRTHDPWLLRCQPADADFRVPEVSLPAELSLARMSGRRALLAQIEQLDRAAQGATSLLPTYDAATRQALDLVTSPECRGAFRLEDEPAERRERYGRTQFGQSVLLARRLIDAGTRLVQVNWFRSPDEPADAPCWDSHVGEARRLRTALLPPFDQTFSALIEDLQDTGKLDETLIVVASEFGRSPRINAQGGRDHWGSVFSVALAGGGIRGGTIYGASDALGGEPHTGLVRPEDLLATIFHCLGLEPETILHDPLNRPFPIARGQILHDVLI